MSTRQIIKAAGGSAVFSNVVVTGSLVYLAGVIGQKDGKLVPGGIEAETPAAFEVAKERLATVGLDLTDIVNVTIYVNDYKNNLAGLNKVYPAIFADGLPARTAIGVAALPMDAAAEFQIVASKRV
ncbi:hypothetical protein CspHIS471_0313960 [Cutaneotrichosporon sp. HIS471]|nr:hypothetical protein CspHIS471_0313960 [Cutaneotrichosporon sp. HIS471]